MTTWYEGLHAALRMSHIVVGSVGLTLFWLVIFLKKGTVWHRRIGWGFVLSAFFVGGTALISSLWALIHPNSFAPYVAELPSERQLPMYGNIQFLFLILLFLSITTITGAIYGLHSVRFKDNVEALSQTSLPYWQSAAILSSFSLFWYGVYCLVIGPPASDMPRIVYWIPTILGLVGFTETIKERWQAYRPMADSRSWLYRHVEQMFGTSVAFHTAFLVFGARQWFGEYLEGPLFLIPWLAPLVIGGIATKWYVARLRLNQN